MTPTLAKTQRFLKQAATERLGLKLMAFIITVLLVTLVRFQEKSERFFDVEVVPLLPEPTSGLVMTSGFPKTVRVRLSGSSSIISSLLPREIPAIEVDLTNRKVGTSLYYFNDDRFEESLRSRSNKMQFVSVVRTIPESVQVRMERLVSRELPVTVNTAGKLPPGMELVEDPKVKPSEVYAVGPVSQMRGLKSVETDEVFFDGLGVGEHVQIVAATPLEGVSIRGGEEIEVTVKVRYIPGERVFPKVPVRVLNTDLHAEPKPENVAITLSGPEIILEAITLDQLKPSITVPDERSAFPSLIQGDITLPWLPDEVKVTAIEPMSVSVSLTYPLPSKTKKASDEKKKDDK